MKTVFSKTEEVATVWATQSQEKARTGSNTWCEGRVLGSYGTIIARLVDSREGPIALISHETYSSTTAAVIGQAQHEALKAGRVMFRVLRVGPGRYAADFDPKLHDENLVFYAGRINDVIDKIAGAQRFNGAKYRTEALALIGEALIYARAFKLKWAWKGRSPLAIRSRSEEKEGY